MAAATLRRPFRFARAYRVPALLLGITPRTSYVEVSPEELRVRFGPWRLRTSLTNVVAVHLTGDYGYLKSAGPPHLSLADRGITVATNGDAGACVRFAEPVRVLYPTGRWLRHPAATLTVDDPEQVASALAM